MLEWLSFDGKLLLSNRLARSVAYGFLAVILGAYLETLGFSGAEIGVLFTAALAGGALYTIAAGFLVRQLGRRALLMLFAGLMAGAGVAFATSTSYAALLLASLIGAVSVTAGETGPLLSLEQAVIPQTCPPNRRNAAFALYNFLGVLAAGAGALLGLLPSRFQRAFGLSPVASMASMFWILAGLGLLSLVLYALLSKEVEAGGGPSAVRGSKKLSKRSASRVAELSLLFALDSFAGGFVIQSFVAYWFFTRFGIPLDHLAIIFGVANVLTAFSFFAAARLAQKFGLLRTMVFTHIPSNLLLMAVPLAPGAHLAVGLYLARMALSQMDVPTRQSYLTGIVDEEERVAAAGITNVSRNLSQAVGPSLAGLLQSMNAASPFFLGGGLKIIYDAILFARFRSVAASHEKFLPHD